MSKLRTALAVAIALTTTLTIPPAGHSEPLKLNSVVAVVPDASGKFLVISTSLPSPISAPVIQYFPGADGNTIMVADFFGLKWSKPSAVINYPTNDPRIKQIRYGQFQENPPTFRLSVTTNNPNYLRQLTFKSTPGTLIVKWPSSSNQPASFPKAPVAEIAVAPPIIKKEAAPVVVGTSFGRGSSLNSATQNPANQMSANMPNYVSAVPPVAPPLKNNSRATNDLPPLKTLTAAKPVIAPSAISKATPAIAKTPAAAPVTKKIQETKTTSIKVDTSAAIPEVPNPLKTAQATTSAAFNPVSNSARKLLFTSLSRLQDYDSGNYSASPVEAVLNGNNAVIKVRSNPGVVYRAFRLHDPERYVLDIDGIPELLTAESPVLETNPFLNSIRVGAPSSGENLARIVLDLTNPNLSVKEKLSNGDNLLTLTVSTKENFLDDLTAAPGTKVVLDAGHGGSDPGAQRASIQEKELTLAITEKLKSALLQKGVKVEMTRSDDTFVSLEDRVKLTNASKPHAFVSVHINSLETSSNIQGIETYYQTEQSRPLADVIHQSLIGGLQVPDRSVRKARFYVINHTEVPAVLAEVGYITNKDERDKLISADYQSQIADAIARGVILYLNKHYQASTAPEKTGRLN